MVDFKTSTLQEQKRCIFCGKPPSNKNKEHVIPKWLIELTGDPKRQWNLGVQTKHPDRKLRKYAADQFQFPACEACNSRYSDLEGRTKGYMSDLLAGNNLTAEAWDDFLDWFDKVRIGLWLGNMMLNKDWPIPEPNFYIDQRVGQKDRCVLVYPNEPEAQVLNITGASDPMFMYLPSSFMLVVNSLVFVNISSEFLLSARMGFPYPRKTSVKGTRRYVSDFTATFNARQPFLRFEFYPPRWAVYQTVLLEGSLDAEDYKPLVEHEYIASKRIGGGRTQICTVSPDGVKFHAGGAPVEKAEMADRGLKPLVAYYIRLFEYRQRTLAQSREEFPEMRKFISYLGRFNAEAIAQAKGSTVSVRRRVRDLNPEG